jgi:Glycosyltransferases involved in cell wall biogenesis
MSTQTEQRADVSKNGLAKITFTEPSDVINSEWLVTPKSDRTPELSVVLPTLNEQRGVGECIEQIVNALAMMEISGEIIVADSSDDWTPDIAAMMGAHVVTPDGKGYGYAYQYAFEQARGEYITMGDADTTYDFTSCQSLLHSFVMAMQTWHWVLGSTVRFAQRQCHRYISILGIHY